MFEQLKRVFKHSIIYGIGIVAGKILGFIMIPIYTRFLTPSDYGTLELIERTSAVIWLIILLGIDSAVFRFYFDYKDSEDQKQVLSTALIFNITSALIVTFIIIQFAGYISMLLFGTQTQSYLIRTMLYATFFELALVVPFAFLRIKERSLCFTGLTIARLLIGLSLNIYFVVILRIGVLGILYSTLIAAAFSAAVIIPLLIKEVKIRFSKEKLKQMARYGAPLIPASLAMLILHYSDRFFLVHFSTIHNIGIYALGYNFGMVLHLLITAPFMLVWGPYMFAVTEHPDAKQLYAKILTYFTFVAVLFGLIISVLIKDVIRIVAAPAFYAAYKVVAIVTLGYVLRGMANLLEVGVRLEKKTKYLAIVCGAAAIFNLLLNWLLIPRYDMMGAAWATMVSFVALAAMVYLASNSLYPIKYEFKRLSTIFGAAIFIYLISTLIRTDTLIFSILLKSCLSLSFPILLYVVNFYEPEELRRIRQLRQTVLVKFTSVLKIP